MYTRLAALFLLLTALSAVPAAAAPVLWAVDATRRIGPGDRPESSNRIWSATRREVRLRAAQGESEGFHLVVTAEGAGLGALELIATELTGDAGVIGRKRIHLYREAFFEVSTISNVETRRWSWRLAELHGGASRRSGSRSRSPTPRPGSSRVTSIDWGSPRPRSPTPRPLLPALDIDLFLIDLVLAPWP